MHKPPDRSPASQGVRAHSPCLGNRQFAYCIQKNTVVREAHIQMAKLFECSVEAFEEALRKNFRFNENDLERHGQIFRDLLVARKSRPDVQGKLEAMQTVWNEKRSELPAVRDGLPDPGLLKSLGYLAAAPEPCRHSLLDYVLTAVTLPPIWSEQYMRSWGERLSYERYDKLRNSLIAFADKANFEPHYDEAARSWLRDHDYIWRRAREFGVERLIVPKAMFGGKKEPPSNH